VNVVHVLRGDEDVLLLMRRICRVNLFESTVRMSRSMGEGECPYHHSHRNASVDSVHEDIKLIYRYPFESAATKEMGVR
jgi:hypothetical protein